MDCLDNIAEADGASAESPDAVSRDMATPEDVLVVMPVRDTVLFPGVMLPLSVGRPHSIAALEEVLSSGRKLGVVLQRDAATDDPEPSELYRVGSIARIVRHGKSENGSYHLLVQGEQRFRVLDYLEGFPYLVARAQPLIENQLNGDKPLSSAIESRMRYLRQQAMEALSLLPQAPAELANTVQSINSPAPLADLIASVLDLTPTAKQSVLETLDLVERLDKVTELLNQRIEVLKLTRQIEQRTKESLDERQREVVLREQLKSIQQELGEDGGEDELAELEQAIAAAGMPEEVDKQARKELKRLAKMPEASTEYSMVRSYLEWLVELPWSTLDDESIDIAAAREVLDRDHYGLDTIKRRILEYLAVRKLNPEGRSPILCFVGPPGVGKTSLGQSIARALGLKFARASLGGVHDEAEIRGHRRTYVGALPGSIVQAIRRAGSRNPVFMLDEIDKLGGGGFHGHPASALLEVLDPEQNGSFKDNYLGVDFDLSKVMFIATANVLDSIPAPLRDRMEVIELPGYTEDEKVEIAKRYLLQRQLEANGLDAERASIEPAALRRIVRDYTREAGCRNLERSIGAVLRHSAVRIAEGMAARVDVTVDDLPAALGPRKFENEVALHTSMPGVATGLAWTPVGGDILFVETSLVPGSGKLILTGQLGDIMKESAQAALSLVKARAAELGIATEKFEHNDIHLHLPAGAIPKDGPSAGVAMFTSMVSLLSERTVHNDVAMTGEISLRGLVLPVGGIKEKTLAALRAGIGTVLLPARNRKDLEEIPAAARDQLRFIWLEHVDDALAAAIDPAMVANQSAA